MKAQNRSGNIFNQAQVILDALPFQLALVDKKGIIRRVNAAWKDFARQNEGDAVTVKGVGVDYLAVCSADRSPRGKKVVRGIKDVLSGKSEEFASEYPCHSQDQKRWFIMRVSAVQPVGKGAVIAHFQITDRVLAEKALKTTNAALAKAEKAAKKSEKAKSDFLSQMSHELRTPVNGIVGLTEMLRDTKLESSQVKVLDNLDALNDHLIKILNDVLDLSKIEAGKFSLEERPFNPAAVAMGVREMLNRLALEKGLELTWQASADFPSMVLGDTRRLRQILINLVGNAIKFTDRGSVRITARAQVRESGRIELEFSVQDSGIGISPEAAKSLFQRFIQVKGNSESRGSGTGLGLAISKHLAQAMGGDVTLESAPGKGSVFRFSILVEASEFPSLAGENSQEDGGIAHSGTGKILITDDNDLNKRILQTILEKLGWTVLAANNGQEALEALEAGPVDAVMLDCQMPVMDGYSTAAEIRHREKAQGRDRVPIVSITADVMEENLRRCRKSGMDEFLTKPFRRLDVVGLLEKILPKRSSSHNIH